MNTSKGNPENLGDLYLLNSLRTNAAYARLQAGWALQAHPIMEGLRKASKEKGKDESLRYWAGMWSGFELAIGQLDRMIADAEKETKSPADKISEIINRRNP